MIVSPTKVGYIIMTTDIGRLTRMFSSKKRPLNKPGVVLCGSMEQLRQLAILNAEIDAFYRTAWDNDILLGCILPWKADAKEHIPHGGSESLMMDQRSTSCFVVKFGAQSELSRVRFGRIMGSRRLPAPRIPRARATPVASTASESA